MPLKGIVTTITEWLTNIFGVLLRYVTLGPVNMGFGTMRLDPELNIIKLLSAFLGS